MHLQKQKKHWLIRLNKVIGKENLSVADSLLGRSEKKMYKKIGKNHKKQLTF